MRSELLASQPLPWGWRGWHPSWPADPPAAGCQAGTPDPTHIQPQGDAFMAAACSNPRDLTGMCHLCRRGCPGPDCPPLKAWLRADRSWQAGLWARAGSQPQTTYVMALPGRRRGPASRAETQRGLGTVVCVNSCTTGPTCRSVHSLRGEAGRCVCAGIRPQLQPSCNLIPSLPPPRSVNRIAGEPGPRQG